MAPAPRRDQRPRSVQPARAGAMGTRRWVLIGLAAVAGLLAIAAIVAAIVQSVGGSQQVALAGREVYQPPTGYNQHVPEGTVVQYANNPPSSGQHYSTPANWGVYPTQLATSTWVHNLEHGGIVILYRCSGSCPDLAQSVQAVYNQISPDPLFQEKKVVATPYANLDHLVRAQAWGWTLPLDTVDSKAIDAFYTEHVDQGPEKIP